MIQTYLVTVITGEDGYIVAECPALPGRVSQGKTARFPSKPQYVDSGCGRA